jgi:hypothetical protein
MQDLREWEDVYLLSRLSAMSWTPSLSQKLGGVILSSLSRQMAEYWKVMSSNIAVSDRLVITTQSMRF